MGNDGRRGTVTEEHKAEARRLRAIWEAAKDRRERDGALTQEAFGSRWGVGNQAAVGFFLNGNTALSLKAALAFARGLGCTVADFSPRLAALLQDQAPRPLSRMALEVARLYDELPGSRQRILYATAHAMHNPEGEDIHLDLETGEPAAKPKRARRTAP